MYPGAPLGSPTRLGGLRRTLGLSDKLFCMGCGRKRLTHTRASPGSAHLRRTWSDSALGPPPRNRPGCLAGCPPGPCWAGPRGAWAWLPESRAVVPENESSLPPHSPMAPYPGASTSLLRPGSWPPAGAALVVRSWTERLPQVDHSRSFCLTPQRAVGPDALPRSGPPATNMRASFSGPVRRGSPSSFQWNVTGFPFRTLPQGHRGLRASLGSVSHVPMRPCSRVPWPGRLLP